MEGKLQKISERVDMSNQDFKAKLKDLVAKRHKRKNGLFGITNERFGTWVWEIEWGHGLGSLIETLQDAMKTTYEQGQIDKVPQIAAAGSLLSTVAMTQRLVGSLSRKSGRQPTKAAYR